MNFLQRLAFQKFTTEDTNLALLGPAGTGKSYVLKKMQEYCDEFQIPYLVTATTGVSAELVNGTTIHSALGLGIDFSNPMAMVEKIKKNPRALAAWKNTHVLFVDEISLMSAQLLDAIDCVGQLIKNSLDPFGGLRLVVSGDFLQLGPVCTRSQPTLYAFEAEIWPHAFPDEACVVFEEILRQTDPTWIDILMRVRIGKLTPTDFATLAKPKPIDETMIRVFCDNRNVDAENNQRLQKMIDGGAKHEVYKECITMSGGSVPPRTTEKSLRVCVGARVMHNRNDHVNKIWNGSMGTVQDLDTKSVLVKFDNGKSVTINFCKTETSIPNTKFVWTRVFMPLNLCWAATVHKLQGATLEKGVVTMRAYQPNQAYSGLSRFSNLEHLRVVALHPSSIKVDEKCVNFYSRFIKSCASA